MISDRKYIILNVSEITDQILGDTLSTGVRLRRSADGSKTVVGYEGSQPSSLDGKVELSHSEILAELRKDEWRIDV